MAVPLATACRGALIRGLAESVASAFLKAVILPTWIETAFTSTRGLRIPGPRSPSHSAKSAK